MPFRLLPRGVRFFELFSRQNAKIVEAAAELEALAGDPSRAAMSCTRVAQIERETNELTQLIARELATTSITPIDREDIHQLNARQEELVDLLDAIATRMGLFGESRPMPAARSLLGILAAMTRADAKALALVAEKQSPDAPLVELRAGKREASRLLPLALGELYESEAEEGRAGMVHLLKWTQIYERIEQAIQGAERLGGVLEGISLKNA